MPSFQILRCANAQLYIAAAVITPAWAAHYALLRYTVDATGITRRSMLGSTSIKWSELTSATLQESNNQGTASCTIRLQTEHACMSISSDTLPLEDVQNLANELRENGLLH